MAAIVSLPVFVVLSFTLFIIIYAADVRVSISTPTEPVTVGGILAIQCQVWNSEPDYAMYIFRTVTKRSEQITNEQDIIQSSERLNMFLAKRTFLDGSSVYFLTIVDISEADQGEYLCTVHDNSKRTYITEESMNVNIYSYPADIYPLCSSLPNQPSTLNVQDTITLKCTTEKGMPSIQMKWVNTKIALHLKPFNTTEGNLVHSTINVRLDESFHWSVFYCEVTSKGFPDWKRTCAVGPVKLRSYFLSAGGDDKVVDTQAGVDQAGIEEQQDTERIRLIEQCEECSPTDDMLRLYLTAATIGATFLTIIFLTSTIILCYKYHHISDVTRREPTRVLTPQQSIEPVYVSLQRRSVNADLEYMTLEDPNNPDNKIILPKETFDDYCRTLTLKRV